MIIGKKNVAGRNNSGKITVRHIGGGHKKKYRKIDFRRNKDSIGIVTSLEYDPCRTAFIASVYDFLNQKYFYMIAPQNLSIGDVVKSGFNAEVKVGHSLTLMKVPIGGARKGRFKTLFKEQYKGTMYPEDAAELGYGYSKLAYGV